MVRNIFTGSILFLLVMAYSSCHLGRFEQEIEVEIVFDSRSARGPITASQLFNINEYSSDFKDFQKYIEDLEVRSVTGRLNEFFGPSGQVLTDGLLTISDQDGHGPEVLAILPSVNLEELYISEQALAMEEPGRQRLEELLLQSPNTCLGVFTGEVDQPPSDFVITFHIKLVIRGSFL